MIKPKTAGPSSNKMRKLDGSLLLTTASHNGVVFLALLNSFMAQLRIPELAEKDKAVINVGNML